MTKTLRVGTRGSPLALAQTEEVLSRLRESHPELAFETVVVETHGDAGYRTDLGSSLEGKRAFTKRIEDELLAGRIDFAVHSLKDLPTDMPPGLTLAAVPPRSDPRDVLVAKDGVTTESLGPGTRLGTSSLRRRAQLLARWPGLDVRDLRGNVGTRLRRLDSGEFDAIVVAAAGLHRLGLASRISESLSPEVLTPAPGQGALGVEARVEDRDLLRVLASLDDPTARRTTQAERELSSRLGGGCNVPFGALAELRGGRLSLQAVLASPNGQRIVRAVGAGPAERWEAVVESVWKDLLDRAGPIRTWEAE